MYRINLFYIYQFKKVFETNDESEDSGYDDESLDSVAVVDQPDQPAAQADHQTDSIERPEQSSAKTDSSNDATEQPTQPNTPSDTLKGETEAPETDAESEKTSEDTGSDALVPVKRKRPERNLLTDVYQINVSGNIIKHVLKKDNDVCFNLSFLDRLSKTLPMDLCHLYTMPY